MADTPQESPDTPLDLEDSSPLRMMIAEVHEIYAELLYVGFTERAAGQIVAHMMSDALAYRNGYEQEDDDSDDSEDDLDSEPDQ